MRHRLIFTALASLMIASLALAQSDMKSGGSHVMLGANDVKWMPAPSLPPGAQLALIEGNPAQAGSPFTIRVKAPDGYRVPPHWHPVAENVTVLQGTFYMGMGEKFDEKAAKELKAGSFASMPKGMAHFAWTKGETIIQVHGIGPFELVYVNAADDPRKKSSSK
jgi:Domain of unknown function (DUF4437)